MSMARSVALGVMDHLYVTERTGYYKVECPYIRENVNKVHIRSRLESEPFQRTMASRGWIYGSMYCDLCLTGPGEFDFMYHCEVEDTICDHDLCVSCVYDIVKKYEQLTALLLDLLGDDLTTDCIQTVAVLVVGNVFKI